MAVAGARELKDGEVVAVGLGLPVVASFLAKQTHAPNMTILFELGVIDPEPIHAGVGLADPRVWYRAKVMSSFVDILGTVLHRGLVDVGFLGGLEADQYGNLNTTLVGDPRGQFRHMVGSGGANDIASCARRTIIIIRHEARKLRKGDLVRDQSRVPYRRRQPGRGWTAGRTQPGDHRQGDLRLPPGDQADDAAHHSSGQSRLEDVLGNMGFAPLVPAKVPFTEPPEAESVEADPREPSIRIACTWGSRVERGSRSRLVREHALHRD